MRQNQILFAHELMNRTVRTFCLFMLGRPHTNFSQHGDAGVAFLRRDAYALLPHRFHLSFDAVCGSPCLVPRQRPGVVRLDRALACDHATVGSHNACNSCWFITKCYTINWFAVVVWFPPRVVSSPRSASPVVSTRRSSYPAFAFAARARCLLPCPPHRSMC